MKRAATHTRVSETLIERRKAVRYRMRAPVVFRWKGSRAEDFYGEGTTLNISVSGVCISTPTCPPANSTVYVEVILPRLNSPLKTRIKAEMKVVRVKNEGNGDGQPGFSAVGKGFILRGLSK
jgi:hypothetical protein